MQRIWHVEKLPEKEDLFSLEDLENYLFYSSGPTYVCYPFEKLKRSPLSNVQMVLKILSTEEDTDIITDLTRSIISIGNFSPTTVTFQHLTALYPWMYYQIVSEYQRIVDHWRSYALTNMTKFIKEPTSKLQWHTFKAAGVTSVFNAARLNFIQKFWISSNVIQDQNQWVDFALDVKESLLPWLNNKLFQEYSKKKDNTRVNVDYDKQRKALWESATDIAPQFTNTLLDDLIDLDIVE